LERDGLFDGEGLFDDEDELLMKKGQFFESSIANSNLVGFVLFMFLLAQNNNQMQFFLSFESK